MIHPLPHTITEGLRKENQVQTQRASRCTLERIRSKYPTLRAYLQKWAHHDEGLQFAEAMKALRPGSKVLDIGAGFGRTSLYLASLGHQVAAVEPSLDLCRVMENAAGLYGLSLDIYHVSAEYLDRLPARGFDACVFNASFHHCDEPARALANCHALLAPGGKVFLLNEPLLHSFRSKAWFHRQLEQGTLVTGHYGGNEHTYYRREYVALLRAARFADIQDRLSFRYHHPERYLDRLEGRRVARGKVLARKVYYRLVMGLTKCGALGRPALFLLKRLSLVQTYFIATKQAAA